MEFRSVFVDSRAVKFGRIAGAVLFLFMVFPSLVSGEVRKIRLGGQWWEVPAAPSRHTSFVATFNSETSDDADFARGNALAGGFGMGADAEGRYGGGTQVAEKGGHLHYLAENNINPNRGTIRLLVRGAVWQDETPRWLFELRGHERIGILRTVDALSLVFHRGRQTADPIAQIDLPIADVSPDAWHSVVASWDREKGEGAIALDGRGVRGAMAFPEAQRPMLVFYLAGGFGGRKGGMNEVGLGLDEVVIYDQFLDQLQSDPTELPEEDMALLPRAEEGARRTLNSISDLQRWGGWQTIHTWPTLLGSSAQGREFVNFSDAVGNDKSHASPYIAARFLYAYEVLGDYRFLETALRTADMLLAAQDSSGFWVHGYRMTVNGIVPAASSRHIKLQDSVQTHPLFLFAYLYRLTGEARYLDAVKRSGEFLLGAQNPNGSWSHHFDAESGIGRTARNDPQGGEINDRCMSDCIDAMILMAHLTGDRRYVSALRRAGDWLVGAQLEGATRGWAEQYDRDDNPVWARHFEPPSCSRTATFSACRALVEIYRVSGDGRYLEPIRECLKWMDEKFPDGRMWCYYTLDDGRPIAGWQRKVYHMDDEAESAWVSDQPIGSWQLRASPYVGRVRRILEAADDRTSRFSSVDADAVRESLADLRSRAETAMAGQNEAGLWVTSNVAGFMGSLGAGISTHQPRVLHLIRYIEAARMAAGELPLKWRGNGDLLRLAYPGENWYEVGWGKAGN